MEIPEPYKTRMLTALNKEKIVLFIGAGCSKECGIPDQKDIVKIFKEFFKDIEFQSNNFLDICYDIVETPPHTRSEILELLKKNLNPRTKAPAFEIVPKIPWGAIFTTNYDIQIEEYYRECEDKPYELWTVKGLLPREPIQSRKYTMLYKLMGSIDSDEIEEGGPILTRAEYRNSISGMDRYYERLQDALLDGVLVFIGYSLKDIDVMHTLDKLREEMRDNLPYSYFISPNANSESQRATKLNERRIIPIEGTFKDFIHFLHGNLNNVYKIDLSEDHCKINKIIIPIPKTDFQIHRDEFDLITEESIEETVKLDDKIFIEDFFKGKTFDWSPFIHKIDFIRDIYYGGFSSKGKLKNKSDNFYTEGLWTFIQKELNDKRSQVNKIILIQGMPGSGKSTLLKRIGFNIYKNISLPVIYLKNTSIIFENRYIDKITTFLWEKYTDLQEKPGMGEEVKFTILIDNLGNHTQQIVALFKHLKSKGKPCLFIVTERSRDWDNIKYELAIRPEDIIEFKIPDSLSNNEMDRIIKYLHELKYIEEPGEHWKQIITQNFEKSFFITLYSIVRHSRKPLEKIIQDQFNKLSTDIQNMYLYISAVDQFDGDINVELLIRTLKKSYGDFERELLIAENDGIFFRHEMESNYIVLKTHHRIIAKKTLEFFAPDPEKQKQILKDIISNISSSSDFEVNLGMYLVIDCFGPNAHDEIFSLEQKEVLLKTFLEIEENKVVRHHLGILQKKLGSNRHSDAYSNLIKALKMPSMSIAGRIEYNTNILVSLGDLFIKMALKSDIDDGTFESVFNNGESYLKTSIEEDPSNIFAYHAYSNLLKLKALRLGDKPESLKYFMYALEQIEVGLSYSLEDIDQKLNNLKIEILKRLKGLDVVEKYADDLYKRSNDTSGYYTIAKLLFEDFKSTKDKTNLQDALSICEKALHLNPTDYNLLKLKYDIIGITEPNNYQYQYQTLTIINNLQMRIPFYLKFRYAYLCFVLHYYTQASKRFIELRDLTEKLSEPTRTTIREYLKDERGETLRLKGEIVKIMSNKSGRIRIIDLPGLEWLIHYTPLETKEFLPVGTPIWSILGFSYMGPIAKNVNRRI